MNGKQAKKLRKMAILLHEGIPEHPEGKPKKSAARIYQGLKAVHKKVINGKKNKASNFK